MHEALVRILDTGTGEYGTGFVVATDVAKHKSFVLTAAHVVQCPVETAHIWVYLHDDTDHPEEGTLAKCPVVDPDKAKMGGEESVDLALISINTAPVQPLYVTWEASEGEHIAVTGYPISSQIAEETTKELRPSVHEGIVSAVRLDGQRLEHSAVTDFGNSGGPVFDIRTGFVIGVVSGREQSATGAYIATGPRATITFLQSAEEPAGFSLPRQEEVLGFPRNGVTPLLYARKLVFVTLGDLYPAAVELTGTVRSAFLSSLGVTYTDARLPDDWQTFRARAAASGLGDLCANKAVAVAVYYPEATGPSEHTVSLWDCRGNPVDRSMDFSMSVASVAELRKRVGDAAQEYEEKIQREPTHFQNLLTYGVWIGDGQETQDFHMLAAAGRVQVDSVVRGSPAWAAGLRSGVVVDHVNGHGTAGHTQAMLDLEAEHFWDLAGPANPSGYCFPAGTLRWYFSAEQRHSWPCPSMKQALPEPDVNYDPAVIQGDATFDGSGIVEIDFGRAFTAGGYVIQATDMTDPSHPVVVVSKETTGCRLSGKSADKVHWIAVGTLDPNQALRARENPKP